MKTLPTKLVVTEHAFNGDEPRVMFCLRSPDFDADGRFGESWASMTETHPDKIETTRALFRAIAKSYAP